MHNKELPPGAQQLIDRCLSREIQAGVRVLGGDSDEERLEALRRGQSYVGDVPSEDLAPPVVQGRLRGSASYADLAGADAVSICVPTPLRKTGDPDLSFILSATRALLPALHSPIAGILRASTYLRFTRGRVLPAR